MRVSKTGLETDHSNPSDPSERSVPAPKSRIRPVKSARSVDSEKQDHIPDNDVTTAVADSEPPVGYRNPPKHSQFRKGQSGNPAGRPQGANGLKQLVRENLLAKVSIRTKDGTRRVPKIQALILKQIEQAGKGNQRAANQLMTLYAAAVPEEPDADKTAASEPLTLADEAILSLFREEILSEEGDEE